MDFRFLLAQLHMDSLMSQPTLGHIKRALQNLPQGMKGLDETYEMAMKRIEGQEEGYRKLAKQVLLWVTYAKRALSTTEVQHALAISLGITKLDEDYLPEVEILDSVCAGLVTVDKNSDIIRLVHYTAQEYFKQTSSFPSAETDITVTCVTYLSFDAFETGFCPTDEEFESRLQLNPFYDYAARNWGHHASVASAKVEQLVVDFLRSEAKASSSSQAMMASKLYLDDSGYSQRVPKQMTGLHLVAYFGLTEAMTALLKNEYDLDSKDNNGRTPLSWAAEKGHETVVKQLLEKGAKLESKDNNGRTPLLLAAENGHGTVAKQLLKKGAKLESEDNNGWTPLSTAAMKGHEAVVELLLEKGAELESKDNHDNTPLSWAAWNGHEAVAKLLLAKEGVDPDSKNEHGQTPLSVMAENGHEALVKLLLSKEGVDPDSKDENGQTPLSWAAENGHETVVKLLLAKEGVDPDSKDENGQTPLSWAAENGHEAVVKLLLAKEDVDPDSKDENG